MKPYIGMIVQYRYTPDATPVAGIVTAVHDDKWVALWLFTELSRWVPNVEFALRCTAVEPEKESAPKDDMNGFPLGLWNSP
jgi:hypothetical protein